MLEWQEIPAETSAETSPEAEEALVSRIWDEAYVAGKSAGEVAALETLREKPVYRGILGFLAWVIGKIPDSTGRPSSSWTLYILSHSLPIGTVVALFFAVFMGKATVKSLAALPGWMAWVVLLPLTYSWIAWLAHHKKVAEVVVMIIDAFGRAVAGFKGSNITTVATTASAVIDGTSKKDKPKDKEPPASDVQAGKKVVVKKRDPGEKPKTDPGTLPEPPGMS